MATIKTATEADITSAVATNTKSKQGVIIVITLLACVGLFLFLKYKNNFLH